MILLLAVVNALAFKVLEIGDSNCNSTKVDVIYAGATVPAGYTVLWNGTQETTYSADSSPGVGKVPYIVDMAIANGDTTGWYIRRCVNGGKTTWPGTMNVQWTGALADVATLGGSPDVVLVVEGANDSKTLALANAYEGNMSILLDLIDAQWPGMDVLIARERCTDAGCANPYGTPYLRTNIYPAQDNLVAAYSNAHLLDGTDCQLTDAIHWSTAHLVAGHVIVHGGQECVANKLWMLSH